MKSYLFYVARDDRQVADLHIAMCPDDEAALVKAEALLTDGRGRLQVEIREGERLVATVDRPVSTAG